MIAETLDLLKKYHKESYLWALRCCLGDQEYAGDALQESYLKILDGRANFAAASTFKTWLFAIIRLTAADLKRKRVLEKIRNLEFGKLFEHDSYRSHEDVDDRESSMIKTVSELSPKQQQILSLVFFHGFSIEGAAAIMKVSIGTARTHYERGKANLKKKMKVYDER